VSAVTKPFVRAHQGSQWSKNRTPVSSKRNFYSSALVYWDPEIFLAKWYLKIIMSSGIWNREEAKRFPFSWIP
jgi:hypothetical protein